MAHTSILWYIKQKEKAGLHKYSMVYYLSKKHKQENNLVEKYPCVSQCVGNCGTV